MAHKVYIVHGKQGSGKTTFLIQLISQLKKEGLSIGGIIAHGFWKNDQRNHFVLENIMTGESLLYCTREAQKDRQKIRHFYINPDGESFGFNALNINNLKSIDLVVIDEVGPFEMEGKGWAQAIDNLVQNSKLPMIWVIRDSLVNDVINKWNLNPENLFNIEEISYSEVSAQLLKDLIH